jgi:uncharacterized protein (TIGR03435 family)
MRHAVLLLLLLSGVSGVAQSTASPRFEVASVKPAGPEREGRTAFRLGPGTDDPERIAIERQSMLRLLAIAYGLDWDQISGPSWLGDEYYAVEAKVPPGTTKEQVKLMWQNLLAERFDLKIRATTKEVSVYELSVAKNGSKLKKSGEVPAPPDPGFPVPRAKTRHAVAMAPPRNVLQTFRSYSMTEFCHDLAWTVSEEGQSPWLGYFSVGRVVDKTGLEGTYDFTLEFAGRYQGGAHPPALPEGQADTAPNLFGALQQQLGLRLDERKARIEALVVEHVNRVPVEN